MKIAIIGAGPGGLATAMILAHQGHTVHIYEKNSTPGGRNGQFQKDGFVHDVGPTFFMYPQFLEEIFQLSGENLQDYVKLTMLDTMYRLTFPSNKTLDLTSDPVKMRERIDSVFPGESKGYDKYCRRESERLERFIPCFRKPYGNLKDFFYPTTLALLGHLDLGKSVHDVLSGYFQNDEVKLAFSFQSKYLGMSPFVCPGAFTMLAYIEHRYGIWHVEGGLSKLAYAMEEVVLKKGVQIFYNTPVERVIVEDGKVVGVQVGGEVRKYDTVIINADFSHAMTTLFDSKDLKKWNAQEVAQKKYSCSTYMLYLGLDTIYTDQPHHHIVFSEKYYENLDDITHERPALDYPSVYVRNASITDPTLAPTGQSELYILVPVSNTRAGVDWDVESPEFRDTVLDIIESRTEMKDLRKHIISEMIYTPKTWESSGVYLGATFNLAHSLDQMLYFRPHNQFEGVENCYIVGGGTHPGSGLPTIYASAMIVAEMIMKKTC